MICELVFGFRGRFGRWEPVHNRQRPLSAGPEALGTHAPLQWGGPTALQSREADWQAYNRARRIDSAFCYKLTEGV